METIQEFKVEDLPNSSFNIFLGKRRSGKSILAEYLVKQMINAKRVNNVFLFSKTGAGFETVCPQPEARMTNIDMLENIVENYKRFNEFNKIVPRKRDRIKLSTVIIIDDMAVDLKTKKFNILEELAVNGRHLAYEPLNLTFLILCQSLTKIPRVVRLNADNIYLNAIASERERSMVLDENFYLIDGSRAGKNEGRALYQEIVTSEPYMFVVIENHKQNCKCYADYVKKYKASI